MPTLTFQHPERLWLSLGLMAVVLVLLYIGYRRSPLRGFTRWAALACKASAWAILALCLTDPVWSRKQPKTGENEVIIIADNSTSLDITEKQGTPTRAAQMRKALGADDTTPPPWLDELGLMFRVKTQLADERLQSVADFSKLNFTGTKSELNRALSTVRSGGTASRVAAVVLITDGSPTDVAAPEASTSTIPVFPVLVGQNSPAPDLHIVGHSITQTSFEDTPVTITAQIAGHGFTGKDIAICVLDEEGRAIVTEKLRLTKDDATQAVRLRVPALKPGVSFYRLAVMEAELVTKVTKDEWKSLSKEATLANNVRHIAIDRGAGPYRVLYVSGRPNWEYKFLRRALMGDEEIQMPSLIRIAKREPKFEWRGRTGETSNPLFRGFGQQGEAQRYDQPVLIRLGTRDSKELSDGFPKSPEELFGEYRAIIIDDLEAAFFTQEQMNLMERFVSERGGALLMLGGQENYQAGGYDHTPVGRMLPVYLDRISQAPAVANGRLNLTREGWLEPWTRLRTAREEDEQRLAQMPGFQSVNQTFSIKPGASVLATVSGDEQDSLPALAAQRFGEGRVASLMIADMWRWGMRDEATAKDLERAWRQMMRWLVVDVPDRIQIVSTPEDGRMKIEVRVRDRAFRAEDDAMVKIEVTGPDGKPSTLFAEPSLKEAGLFEAEFFPRDSGPYRAAATVESTADSTAPAEKILGTKATGWVHDPLAAEFASVKPGTEWMERMAKESGGQMLRLDELGKLPELLKNIRVPVEETVTAPLWHTPWVFALVLALLSAEWFLRRKGGMA
ncbi:putative membrane protein [Prosthecobacter fusiformis]|uniref:Putative membrane protein n=1 Tax=Prosthecobacter fusiformis TaxID=48464 RepID=A0A4R7RZB6_9BACT|nr:glutamine amidotransferase [Prosthecobacter fusiformis]TDU71262.1 putative membrane protein [Prosthecobacter fusiformis]